MRVKFLAQGNNGCLCWGSNSRLTGIDYESDVLPTAPRRPMFIVYSMLVQAKKALSLLFRELGLSNTVKQS